MQERTEQPLDVAQRIGRTMGVPLLLAGLGLGLLAASYTSTPLQAVGVALVAWVGSWACMVLGLAVVLGCWVAWMPGAGMSGQLVQLHPPGPPPGAVVHWRTLPASGERWLVLVVPGHYPRTLLRVPVVLALDEASVRIDWQAARERWPQLWEQAEP